MLFTHCLHLEINHTWARKSGHLYQQCEHSLKPQPLLLLDALLWLQIDHKKENFPGNRHGCWIMPNREQGCWVEIQSGHWKRRCYNNVNLLRTFTCSKDRWFINYTTHGLIRSCLCSLAAICLCIYPIWKQLFQSSRLSAFGKHKTIEKSDCGIRCLTVTVTELLHWEDCNSQREVTYGN